MKAGSAFRNPPIGEEIALLTVLGFSDSGRYHWSFLCRCGRTASIYYASVLRGHTTSCGCYRPDKTIHGNARRGNFSAEYRAWAGMKTRCENPKADNFARYGGRGVRLCDRWHTFENFLSDMGPKPSPKHSLDRINNDGDYEPGNCRWATQHEQGRNRRNNVQISFRGETLVLADWAKRIGIGIAGLSERVRNWPLERALTEKPRRRGDAAA